MRILLTGGSGFVGQALLPLLAHHEILAISRENRAPTSSQINYIQGDLSTHGEWEEKVKSFSPEICVHLAWAGIPDYSFERCQENFNASLNLFGLLAKTECKKVFVAGSVWEYGDLTGSLNEEMLPGSMNLFASFKTAIRTIGKSWAKANNIQLIWGRIFFVYGPNQRPGALIPTCFKSLKNGHAPNIKNPNAKNDFIYISDVARAIVALIDTPGISGVFNIGSGNTNKVADICNWIAESLNSEKPFSALNSSSNESCPQADITLINQKTGWLPEVSIEEGIKNTIEYMEKDHESS